LLVERLSDSRSVAHSPTRANLDGPLIIASCVLIFTGIAIAFL
jgi:hypothetical protein